MRAILVLLGLFALVLVALMSFGLISVGGGEAPRVSVEGGKAPTVDVGSIDVGTTNKTVEVPTVTVEKAKPQ